MDKKEIIEKAYQSAIDYGMEWVSCDLDYDEESYEDFKEQMKEKGSYQVCIFGGEEPYYAMNRFGKEDELYDVMEDGEIFDENQVYHWITLGRIKAWKEMLGKETLGYFCDGYSGYVFDPEVIRPASLKYKGEVVLG